MPLASLQKLATGVSDAAGREVLRSAQLSKHLLLLRQLVERAGGEFEPQARQGGFDAVLRLLVRIDVRHQAEFHAVVAYPHTGAWLMSCLREPTWLDLAHLGSVAATAAIRAGMDFEVPVPARAGTVHLPMLGAADVGAGDRLVTAHGQAGRYWIDAAPVRVELPADPHADLGRWRGLRKLAESSIILDDIDPYRPPAKLGFTGRLSAADAEKWRQTFDSAREMLARCDTERAAEVSDLITSIVPLQRTTSGHGVSATSREAFGSFSAVLPHTGEAFAATIVHEGQHNKLAALDTLIPLVTSAPAERYYSPWRTDPRSAYGLLHGCYAFMGVTDFWLTRCAEGPIAAFSFLRSARQVRDTLGPLALSPDLTDAGRKFVASMLEKAETWNTAGFADDVQATVDDALDDHWITWCLSNRVVSRAEIDRLAGAWRAGSGPGGLPVPRLRTASADVFVAGKRLQLAAGRLAGSGVIQGGENTGDLALADHDYSAAQRLFERPMDVASWSGLALASIRTGGSRMWLERPELVRDVHRRLGEMLAEPPAPGVVAEWLASGR
jgi:HEXXH motif-containing protein